MDNGDHNGRRDDKVHAYYEILGQALKELLIEKAVISATEIRAAMERRESITPATGAAVVAKAWVDSKYRQRLIADANSAVKEIGIDLPTTKLVALENTEEIHNVVVCTLCSCYPRDLLGLPPSWYKSKEYRARIVYEPRKVLSEFGTVISEDVEVRVHDSTADMRYLVIPKKPDNSEMWSQSELLALITRDTMIGVAIP